MKQSLFIVFYQKSFHVNLNYISDNKENYKAQYKNITFKKDKLVFKYISKYLYHIYNQDIAGVKKRTEKNKKEKDRTEQKYKFT